MTSNPADLPERLGEYRLCEPLGEGGQGAVYLAQSDTGQRVAIKTLGRLLGDPDARRRFAREAETLRMVAGLHLAQYVDADATPEADPPWIATEYVAGPTLDELIEDGGPLAPEQAAYLGAQLAEGLSYIHRFDVVHRDFKPANIMIDEEGPKIIDFGLSVLEERMGEITAITNTVGTRNWMAPEQARTSQVTAAADLYSLGLVVAFAATGSRPVRGNADQSELPPRLRSVLSDLLDSVPERRPDAWESKKRFLAIAGDRLESVAVPAEPDTRRAVEASPAPAPAPALKRVRPSAARAADAAAAIRADYAKSGAL
ncbi:serine/threonine-protein kinase [Glycomyces niveus]|uniref:Serine/threonine protein kinase n=1 Tax=Glycomyces niveus TaxID=2820287 RepID=A0ABS3UCP4_9ACTN|nr:serine/threonine-protein kinase [Glycomyces sp. NEAU-S30]MBO3735467.1 serine/threonine protein kinase [Glycomyces sp. NEAU-S30]